MRIKNFLLLFISAVLILQLTSCLEFERNIKINPDGSGSEKQRINIDRSFYDMMIMLVSSLDSGKTKGIRDSLYNHDDFVKKIRTDFENTPGVTLNNVEGVTNSDSSTSYFIDYNFNTIKMLGKMTSTNPEGLGEDASKTEVIWEDKGKEIYFRIKYIPKDENGQNNTGKDMAYMFEGKKMKINIEFPYEIKSCNAADYSGNTGHWVIGMKELSEDSSLLMLEAVLKK
ncbi:MAG TPA: hypothetical protein VN514_02510 [Ignavibacteria bacterium]|nr:hypothetical protein [Ignavibacteria bacterium]